MELGGTDLGVALVSLRRRLAASRERFDPGHGGGSRFGLDVLGELALGAFGDLEIDSRALLERLEPLHRNGGEMREHVRAAAVGFDEPEALGIIEPLHCTRCHVVGSCSFPSSLTVSRFSAAVSIFSLKEVLEPEWP